MTIRFLKPRKLGAASESWLRQDVLGLECTAAMCLYFFPELPADLPLSCPLYLEELLRFITDGSNDGTSILVDIAVPMVVAMVSVPFAGRDWYVSVDVILLSIFRKARA